MLRILETLRSRRTRQATRLRRGMTLLEIMIVLAILALVMGLLVGPKVMALFADSKVKIANMAVHKYADEAFVQWSMQHSDKGCPDQLSDLNEYMNSKDVKDPWGHPYKMMCGQTLPPGAQHIAVMSDGEDGKEGTDDDIKSWDDSNQKR